VSGPPVRAAFPLVLPLLAALASCAGGTQSSSQETAVEIPLPDLSRAEAEVVRAVEQARAAVGQTPDSAAAWGLLGDTLRSSGWFTDAALCYAQAERLAPAEFRWPHLIGRSLRHSDPAAAADAFGRALVIDPAYVPALVLRGNCLARLDRPDEARAAFERAARIEASNAHARLGLGQLALARGDFESARTELQAALSIEPRMRRAHRSLAQVWLALGDEARAGEHARSAQRLTADRVLTDPRSDTSVDPAGSSGHLRAGLALMGAGRFDEAIAELEATLAANPEHSLAHFKLGQIAARQGRQHDAVRHLRDARRLRPGHVETRQALAIALVGLGRPEEAATELREAARLEPGNAMLQYMLGDLEIELGNFAEGEAHLREALRLDPLSAEVHFYLGSHLARTGRAAEAIAPLSETVRLRPAGVDARVNLGLALASLGRDREAATQLAKAAWVLATHPHDSIREPARSVALAERAVELSGGRDPVALDALGAAYASAGRYGRAVVAAERAIELAVSDAGPSDEIERRRDLYRRSRPYRAPN
jgi:tetratricopeptide (TPR) repeat protein